MVGTHGLENGPKSSVNQPNPPISFVEIPGVVFDTGIIIRKQMQSGGVFVKLPLGVKWIFPSITFFEE